MSISKVDLASARRNDAGRFLLRGAVGESEAHQQHDGDEHGGAEPAQRPGGAQAVAGEHPVAVQQPAFGQGGVGAFVAAHLHLAVVEVRRPRFVLTVLERLTQRPVHRCQLRRPDLPGAEHRHVPAPHGCRLPRTPVMLFGKDATVGEPSGESAPPMRANARTGPCCRARKPTMPPTARCVHGWSM